MAWVMATAAGKRLVPFRGCGARNTDISEISVAAYARRDISTLAEPPTAVHLDLLGYGR
jgi:hypothetical protein